MTVLLSLLGSTNTSSAEVCFDGIEVGGSRQCSQPLPGESDSLTAKARKQVRMGRVLLVRRRPVQQKNPSRLQLQKPLPTQVLEEVFCHDH